MEIRFRPCCGGLKEAMQELRKFSSINSFMLFIKAKYEKHLNFETFNFENVSFSFYSRDDDRIGWKNIFIVIVYGVPFGYITFDDVDISKYIEFCKIF